MRVQQVDITDPVRWTHGSVKINIVGAESGNGPGSLPSQTQLLPFSNQRTLKGFIPLPLVVSLFSALGVKGTSGVGSMLVQCYYGFNRKWRVMVKHDCLIFLSAGWRWWLYEWGSEVNECGV